MNIPVLLNKYLYNIMTVSNFGSPKWEMNFSKVGPRKHEQTQMFALLAWKRNYERPPRSPREMQIYVILNSGSFECAFRPHHLFGRT